MVFSSLTFLLYFLPISLIGYYLLPKSFKNYWLLIVSLLFYAWGAQGFVAVMVISIVCNYIFARIISSSERIQVKKLFLFFSILFNLGILFYNKYMNLLTDVLHRYVTESIEVTDIILPIGISFFTFQAMSYVIDVYREEVRVQKNILYLGLYISFFPQLVAGPIVRYSTIEKQIENRNTTLRQFCDGVTRFMQGFSQKILLANTMSVIADEAFWRCSSSVSDMSVSLAWLGAIAYSLQIFFDFSGYSSMAIGLGKMFGFEFMENFNYPYLAKSITDFWRRWHISLGQWFRDYVYIPLGGSRVNNRWKLIRNLFIVWTLTGIWHGANFTFVLWGLGYFFLLSFEKLSGDNKKTHGAFSTTINRVITLLFVVLGWVVFRANSVKEAVKYYFSMVGLCGNPMIDKHAARFLWDYKYVFIIALICCTPVLGRIKEYIKRRFNYGWILDIVYDFILIGCVLLSVSCLVMGSNNPFIYFNF